MTTRKKPGGARKLKLGKQTVKDLSPAKRAGRAVKGGAASARECANGTGVSAVWSPTQSPSQQRGCPPVVVVVGP